MIKLIVGYDQNKLIGKNNFLPWNISEEIEHFKNTTIGKTIVMGDVTFDGIGKPLPNRKTIVLTLDKKWNFKHKDVFISHNFKELVDKYKGSDKEDIYICGGSTIYKLFLPYVDEMIISHIKGEYKGDTWFPDWDKELFDIIKTKKYDNFTLKVYKRK